MPSSSEIFDVVREVMVDALGVDDDEVTPEATLIGDLGAESIDFLDIVFRLERAFDIKIPKAELFPENLTASDAGFVQNGKITEAGIKELKTRLPFANVAKLEADPKVENIQDLYTVDMICKFVGAKL